MAQLRRAGEPIELRWPTRRGGEETVSTGHQSLRDQGSMLVCADRSHRRLAMCRDGEAQLSRHALKGYSADVDTSTRDMCSCMKAGQCSAQVRPVTLPQPPTEGGARRTTQDRGRLAGQADSGRIVEAHDEAPAVVGTRLSVIAGGAVEGDGDLVRAFVQREVEGAIFKGEPAVGAAAFGVGVVEVLAHGDEGGVREDPCLADPAERDVFGLIAVGLKGGAEPDDGGWRVVRRELPVEVDEAEAIGGDGLPEFWIGGHGGDSWRGSCGGLRDGRRELPAAEVAGVRGRRIGCGCGREALGRVGCNDEIGEGSGAADFKAALGGGGFELAYFEDGSWDVVEEDVEATAGDDELDVVPIVGEDGCATLVLRKGVPEHEAIDHGRVLDAVVGGAAVGEGADVELFSIAGVLLAKANAGDVLADEVDIELDGAIAEGETVEDGFAFLLDVHDAVGEALDGGEGELGGGVFGVPTRGGHGDRDGSVGGLCEAGRRERCEKESEEAMEARRCGARGEGGRAHEPTF